jgi:Peptidase_C39 like family
MRFESRNDRAVVARAGLVLNPSLHFLGQGRRRFRALALLLLMATVLTLPGAAGAASAAGGKRWAFIGITKFAKFSKSAASLTNETTFTSPIITAPIDWDELVVSWNVLPGVHLKVEARAIYSSHATRYYTMGMWSEDPAQFPRESVRRQRDEDGLVKMDTLVLSNVTRKVQLRITAGGAGDQRMLKFLGLSFCNSAIPATALAPNRAAWGKVLEVPERRQGEYEGGGGWCSPTSLSMDLAYWSEQLHRPELNHTVPETANAIADGLRDDTGNWPFNTAYAGSYPGMRAYVTRLGDVAELEDWIAVGIPVIISVSSYLTNDRTNGPDNGHLIVCVGFTEKGDVVTNNPGVSVIRNVRARQVYAREKVVNAWKKSKNTVYLIYPESAKVPANRLGHWASGG